MFGDSTGLSGVGSRLVAFGVGEGPNLLRPARNTDKQHQILIAARGRLGAWRLGRLGSVTLSFCGER